LIAVAMGHSISLMPVAISIAKVAAITLGLAAVTGAISGWHTPIPPPALPVAPHSAYTDHSHP
jgi:hypothetical protein